MTLKGDFPGHPFREVVHTAIVQPPVFASLHGHTAVFDFDTIDVKNEVPGRELEAVAEDEIAESMYDIEWLSGGGYVTTKQV